MTRLLIVLVPLAFGGFVGAVLGAIITGDPNYTIAWAVGMGVVMALLLMLGSARGSRILGRTGSAPRFGRGIISTLPGVAQPAPQQAVLNPESTAVPSAGVVLNGEPISGDGTGPTVDTAGAAATTSRRPVGWRRAGVILLIASGAAAALVPAYPMIGWIVTDGAQGRLFDGRDMRTGLHQQEAFDQIADVTDRYMWRYGRAFRDGADFSQPTDIAAELFDAGDIDMSIIARLVEESKRDSGLTGIDAVYPSVRRFSGEQPEVTISLSTPYKDATYTYSVTGELLSRSGTLFD